MCARTRATSPATKPLRRVFGIGIPIERNSQIVQFRNDSSTADWYCSRDLSSLGTCGSISSKIELSIFAIDWLLIHMLK